MPGIREQAITGVKKGDVFTITRTFSQQETNEFGDLTRDYNPVHYDREFTRVSGYPDLICHGLLIGGMICEIGGQLGWLATSMEFKYLRPVFFNDTVTCRLEIIDLDQKGRARASAEFFNQKGEKVLEAGLGGYLPHQGKRKVLARMRVRED